MSRGGFLLGEFLVSLLVGTLIIFSTFYFLCSVMNTSYRVMGMYSHYSALLCASSLIETLLRQAPASRDQWKKMSRDELVWSGDKDDRGLCLNKDELVFVVGAYDDKRQSWLRQINRSILLRQVTELVFSYDTRRPMTVCYKIVTPTDVVEKDVCCLGV